MDRIEISMNELFGVFTKNANFKEEKNSAIMRAENEMERNVNVLFCVKYYAKSSMLNVAYVLKLRRVKCAFARLLYL